MIMPAIMRQRADIPSSCVKFRPSHIPEFANVIQVAEKPRGLFAVSTRILALVARNNGEFGISKRFPHIAELPYARRFPSVSHAEVFGVLEQAGDIKAQRLRRLGSLNAADGKMHKLVAGFRSLLLKSKLAGKPPGMISIPAWLGARLVRPIRPTPGSARRAENDNVELAPADLLQPSFLSSFIHEVVLIAAHQNVDLVEAQANLGVDAHSFQEIGNARLPLHAREEVGHTQSWSPIRGLNRHGTS